jgi:anaerobic selenocysteine-containing dehydrogenase
MTRTGVLHIELGESRVGTRLLARCDAQNPLKAATTFVKARGLKDGQRIRVTGDEGTIGSVTVICITAAEAAE